jgi:integrase/recombinase XerC
MTQLTNFAPAGAELDVHHNAWMGAGAKPRAAAAARDHDHDTLWSLVAAMLAEGDRVSPHTVRAYHAGVLRYLAWAKASGVAILRPERGTGTRYRLDLMRAYANPGTVNTRLSGARALYRALAWIGLEHADPFAQVRGIRDGRAPEAVRPAYSHREVAALLGAATDPHDRVVILLGADAGLRAAEMLALDWAHVTLPDRDASGAWSDTGAMLVHGKGRTERVMPIGDELADALDALPSRSGAVVAHVRSSSGLRYRVACLATRAGLIEHARPPKGTARRGMTLGLHRLRHRFGTDVVREHGIAVGQAALRHSNPQTTARYAKEREHQVAALVRTLRRG